NGFCQGLYEICKNEKPTQETEKNRVSNYLYASFETLCEIDACLPQMGTHRPRSIQCRWRQPFPAPACESPAGSYGISDYLTPAPEMRV
ncbi:MAG: hypothetical protein ABSA57_22110, partial [Candidatus Acidiferrales bacterium]